MTPIRVAAAQGTFPNTGPVQGHLRRLEVGAYLLTQMSNPVHVVLLLALIAFFIGPGVLTAQFAARRGRSFAVYLIASLLIGWPIPLIAALILPRRDVPA
jgi:hypothetical protein